ncbi:MAG: rhamnulokinase family protein [Armatimonadota bacterium]|nr:rhamnulokinase [bacterium]
MAKAQKYLAFDFGASSGRAVLGTIANGKLEMEEVHRFPNGPVMVNGCAYWDAFRLLEEIKQGIKLAVRAHGEEIAGIGIDTWGVDFGLLGPNDLLIEMPRHYRDSRTDGMIEKAGEIVPLSDIYAETGIQFMQFNTIFQLFAIAQSNPWMLDTAQSMLMMPDLFNFWLTGVKSNEFTIVSTSGMYDPKTGDWSRCLLERLGIPTHMLGKICRPGTVIGTLQASVAEETKAHAIPVVAVASHDTGSAVAAVPSDNPDSAYLSSGTWSLLGIECDQPIINEQSRALNFTNEGGVGGVRFLRNVMGLWLVQECRRAWKEAGHEFSFGELASLAESAQPFRSIIDPDDESFLKPCDMPERIREFCKKTGQPVPEDEGAVIRTALDSLALKYRWVISSIESLTGKTIPQINIVGGGVNNKLLCRLTADVTGKPVLAGPSEATAIGNILVQAMGLGQLNSLQECREIVRNSFDLDSYTPQPLPEVEEACAKFESIQGK